MSAVKEMPDIMIPGKSPGTAWTVLLADDNKVDQALVIHLLEKSGHTVVVADHGIAVLEALEQQTFDLVLMDVQMPGMDGLAATVAIRQWEKTTGRHLPILGMTAIGDEERCLRSGMDGYIAKPIRHVDVCKTIESVLARLSQLPLDIGSPTREPGPPS